MTGIAVAQIMMPRFIIKFRRQMRKKVSQQQGNWCNSLLYSIVFQKFGLNIRISYKKLERGTVVTAGKVCCAGTRTENKTPALQ